MNEVSYESEEPREYLRLRNMELEWGASGKYLGYYSNESFKSLDFSIIKTLL